MAFLAIPPARENCRCQWAELHFINLLKVHLLVLMLSVCQWQWRLPVCRSIWVKSQISRIVLSLPCWSQTNWLPNQHEHKILHYIHTQRAFWGNLSIVDGQSIQKHSYGGRDHILESVRKWANYRCLLISKNYYKMRVSRKLPKSDLEKDLVSCWKSHLASLWWSNTLREYCKEASHSQKGKEERDDV